MALQVRRLTAEEETELRRRMASRTLPARMVERARMIWSLHEGERVEAWLPPDAAPVYAILDNLSAHRATDVLLFSLAHPRWDDATARAGISRLPKVVLTWRMDHLDAEEPELAQGLCGHHDADQRHDECADEGNSPREAALKGRLGVR